MFLFLLFVQFVGEMLALVERWKEYGSRKRSIVLLGGLVHNRFLFYYTDSSLLLKKKDLC